MTRRDRLSPEAEEHLRRRLHRSAATARTSPDALAKIMTRATGMVAPGARQRRWLHAGVAAVAAVALALVFVARTADDGEIDLADARGAPPPPISLEVGGVTYEVRLEGEQMCLQGGLLRGRVCQGTDSATPNARLDPSGRGDEVNVLFVVAPGRTSLVPPERASSAEASAANSTVLVGHVADDFACVPYTNLAGVVGLISVGLPFSSDVTRADPTIRCP